MRLSSCLLFAFILAFASCDNKDEEVLTGAPSGFSFSLNGGATVKADSAWMHFDSNQNRWQISAVKGTPGAAGFYTVQLSPTSNVVGTYPIGSPSPTNSVVYLMDNNIVGYFGQGSIVISAKSGFSVSGSFTGTSGTDPAYTSISGTFTNVTVK